MIALLLALQAATPAPVSPPIEALPVAAAGLATRVTFDAAGAITGCVTEVHGMQGPIDGCPLFARPSVLVRWLGRPTAGLGWATVRLDGVPAGASVPPTPGANRRPLAAATVAIAADGTIARCAPAPTDGTTPAFDLCALMPRGGALFTPMPAGKGTRTLDVTFAVESPST